MKKLRHRFFLIILLLPLSLLAQYDFSGFIDKNNWNGNVYLSLVEDYRKISGVYPEQILSKITPDSSGYFSFYGDNLGDENKIYRIHVDTCSEATQDLTHFTGHCANSKEIIFIANNNDVLSLPFSFDKEMFCSIISENEKTKTFTKIDSLRNDMQYDFGSYRSEANRKINSKKWFTVLQNYGELLQEPLAELYIYSFLSNRSNDLYSYYLKDLKENDYYDNLLNRLQTKYPESSYTKQYERELKADKFLITPKKNTSLYWWFYLLIILLIGSIGSNFYFFGKLKAIKKHSSSTKKLTQQEQNILNLILENNSNKEIADKMFVSVSTVKSHINNLYKKLNISSRDEVKNMFN